jgi:hypothetical protein
MADTLRMMAGEAVDDIFPVHNTGNSGLIQVVYQPVRVIYILARCWVALREEELKT